MLVALIFSASSRRRAGAHRRCSPRDPVLWGLCTLPEGGGPPGTPAFSRLPRTTVGCTSDGHRGARPHFRTANLEPAWCAPAGITGLRSCPCESEGTARGPLTWSFQRTSHRKEYPGWMSGSLGYKTPRRVAFLFCFVSFFEYTVCGLVFSFFLHLQIFSNFLQVLFYLSFIKVSA